MDYQQRDFDDFGRPSYSRCKFKEHDWWYYYIYAIFVKTPIGTLATIGLTCFVCFVLQRRQIAVRDEMILMVPAI